MHWLDIAAAGDDDRVAAHAELGMGDIARAVGQPESARDYYERVQARGRPDTADLVRSRLESLTG